MKFISNKHKRKTIVFILSIVLIIGGVVIGTSASHTPSSETNVPNTTIGSPNLEIILGESDGDLIDIYDQGSLAEENLQIVLEVSDNIGKIKMITPVKLEGLTDKLPLGASEEFVTVTKDVEHKSEKTDDSELDSDVTIAEKNVRSLALGVSGEEEAVNTVAFDAPVYGEYLFELYDNDDQLIKTVPYHLGLYANNITMDYLVDQVSGKKSFYRFDNRVHYDMKYTPASNDRKETLVLTLPPFMEMGLVPESVPGSYTVTNSNVLLPAAYYGDADSAILLNYATSRYVRVQQITIEMEATFEETLSLAFYIYNPDVRTGVAKFSEISDLMALYGTNYDKVPFKFVAEAKFSDNNSQIDLKELVGDSGIKDANGNLIPENLTLTPNMPTEITPSYKYYYGPPYYASGYANAGRTPGTTWTPELHYPITDIVYSYKQTEPRLVIPASIYYAKDTTTVPGETWYVSTPPSKYPVHSLTSLSPMGLPMNLPNKADLFPTEVFGHGEWWIKYTYKGVNHNIPIAKLKDYVVPDYYVDIDNFSNAYGNSLGGIGTQRYQDFDGDIFTVKAGKYSENYLQYPDAKNLEIKTEFPFGYSPKSLKVNGLGNVPNNGTTWTYQYPLVKYRYHGESTWGNIQLYGSSSSGSTSTATFPVSDKSIAEVIIHYDLLSGSRWGTNDYVYTIKSGSVDINGVPLGDRFVTKLDTTLSLESVKRQTDGTQYLDPYTKSLSQELILVKKEAELLQDSLRFNNIGDEYYSNRRYKTSQYSAFGTDKRIFAENPSDGNNFYGWGFGLKKASAKMINYENVKIKINNDTEDEKKALSLMSGVNFNDYAKVGVVYEKRDFYYTTNLNPEPRKARIDSFQYSRMEAVFSLTAGEYVTGVEIDFGTVYGEALPNWSSRTDTVDYVITSASTYYFKPMYRDLREFYYGSPKAEKIADNTKLDVSATISTDTTAKHINDQQPGEYFNDTAKGSLTINTVAKAAYTQGTNYINNASWNNSAKAYNQGGLVKFTMAGTPNINFTEYAVTNVHGKITKEYPYTTNYYFEVDENFQLLSIGPDWSLVKTLPIPANKTVLYVFSGVIPANVTGGAVSFPMEFYVRPDTPIISGNYEILKNCGYSIDSFENAYMTPASGDDAYYTQGYPFARFTIPGYAFPIHWQATDAKFVGTKPNTSYPTQVTVGKMDFLDIKMNPSVASNTAPQKISFKEHQKDELSVTAFLNGGASGVSRYKAKFELPTKGVPTVSKETSGEVNLPNDDTLYLRGLPTFERDAPGAGDNLEFTYFDKDGVSVVLSDPPAQAELDQVRSVVVYFENFSGGKVYALNLPLESKTPKTGDQILDWKANVGAGFVTENMALPYNVVTASTFTYESYSLGMKLGVDRNENGLFTSLLANGIVDVKVYYNGGSTPIYASDIGGQLSIPINVDGEKITVSIKDAYKNIYRITVPNANANLPGNSKFPVTSGNVHTSELTINPADLIANNRTAYDLNLVSYPQITAYDVSVNHKLLTNLSYYVHYTLKFRDNGTVPAALKTKYNLQIAAADPTIALFDSIDLVTGLKKNKTTAFTISGKNTFGDSFSGSANITVVPILVRGTFKPVLSNGSIQVDSSDKFEFTIWPDQLDNPSKQIVLDSQLGLASSFNNAESASKHYLKATDLTDGYVIDKLELKYTNYNTGLPTTAILPLTIEDADEMIYSFVLPDPNEYTWGMDSMTIDATLSNRKSNVTVKKEFANNSIVLDPDQLYSIKVEDVTAGLIPTPPPLFSGDLKINQSETKSDMMFGHTYRITENPVASHKIDSVKIVKSNGAATVIQPTPISDWVYEFTVKAEHEGGKITVVNKLLEGGGINLTKELDTHGLKGEEFKFKLVGGPTGPTGTGKKLTFYGIADFTQTNSGGTVPVKWYNSETPSPAALVNVSGLPVGTYQLNEVASTGTTNFKFGNFDYTDTNIQPSGSGLLVTVLEANTAPMAIKAVNTPKTGGKVNVKMEFENDYILDDSTEFKFDLYGPKVGGVMPTTPVTTSVNKGTGWSFERAGLSYGEYEIVLKDENLADYDVSALEIDAQNSTRAIGDKLTFQIGEHTNQYTNLKLVSKVKVKSIGELTLSKLIDGTNTLPDQTYEFVVTDALGNSQTVELKAGESKVLSGLLLGKFTVKETILEDLNHQGLNVNGGNVASAETTLMLASPSQTQPIISTSAVKTDGVVVIDADFAIDTDQPEANEVFGFQIYRSINGGPWEIPNDPIFNKVMLRIGEEHTYSGLLRGAEYKIASANDPLFPFEVREVIINSGDSSTVVDEKVLVFHPVNGMINSDSTFILDVKRMDISIDKFAVLPITTNTNGVLVLPDEIHTQFIETRFIKLPGAKFTLYRYNSIGEKSTADKWKQESDIDGKITFSGLAAGRYTLTETAPPKGFGVVHKDVNFEIHNDLVSGDLTLVITDLPEGIYFDADENTLSIPNVSIIKKTKDYVGGKIDTDSPINMEELEGFEEELEIEPDDSWAILPTTGGFPIIVVAIVGAVILVIGFILKKRSNDKK